MFTLFVALAALGVLLLAVGFALAVKERGKTTKRTGPGIYAEMMRDSMRRDTLRNGDVPIGEWAVSWGKGVAVETEASYTMDEVKQMVNGKQYKRLLPPLLMIPGFVAMLVFAGLAILARATGEMRYAGYFLIVAGAYAAFLMTKDYLKA